jgi:PAS domain S-box-containing protein
MAKAKTKQQLTIENEELQARLQELEDTLEAIRSGAVDAIVASGPAGDRVYTLEGADHAYHTMVESMNEGAVTVLTDGTILYSNRQFGQMTGSSPAGIVGRPFDDFVQPSDHPLWNGFIRQAGSDGMKAEIRLGNQSASEIPVQISANAIDLGGAKALALVVTDLSERRRYEEIVTAERLSRYILEQSLEGVAVCVNGRILFASRRLHEICGTNPVLQRFDKLFSLRVSDGETFSVEIPQSGTIVKNAEVSYRNHDGETYNLILNAGPLFGDDHQILGCLVSLTDITERKRSEDALRASEERFRNFSSMASEGIMIHESGVIVDANPAFADLLGFTGPSDLIGKRGMEAIRLTEPSREILLEHLRTGAVDTYEIELVQPDGTLVPCETSGRDIVWQGRKARLVYMRDITARKNAEMELEKMQFMLSEGQRIAHVGSFEYVAATRTTVWSDEERRIYGLAPGTPPPAYDVMLEKFIHPDDAALLHETFTAAMKNRSDYELEHRIVRPDGSIRTVYDRAYPYFDKDGELLRYLGATLDITERKRAEDMLRQNEERFRVIASSTPDHLLVQDHDLRYTLVVNPQLGLAEQDMIGKTDYDILAKKDADGLAGIKKKVIESGRPASVEMPLAARDGSLQYFSGSYVPTFDAKGRTSGLIGYLRNVTEFRRSREALQRSEARFRLLSGTAGRLLATEDPQGLIEELCRDVMEHLDCQTFFNFMVDERAGRLRLNASAGIPEAEVLKLEWLDYGVAVCGCVARDGVRMIAEDIFHTPDVRTELVKSYGIQAYCCHPLKAGDRLIGTLSFGTKTRMRFTPEEVELMQVVADQVAVAMQRVQARQEITESSRRLQLALDAGGMGMWAWDLQTNRMMSNTRQYELMGLPSGDGAVDAEEFFRNVHPEDAPGLRDSLGEVITRGSQFVREFRIVRSDGQPRWLASVGRVIRAESGQPLSIIGINYDVTDRKKMLEVLRESEERFRGVFDQSLSGIVLCDFAGRILEVNPSFCRILGYTQQELIGRNILELTHPGDREIELAMGTDLKEGRLEGFRLEKRYLGRDGRAIWAEISVGALHDDRGSIVYALGMVEDITDRKAATEALRRSKDELEGKVHERTTELMILLEDLEKSRDDLRRLASELVMAEEMERKRIAVTLHDEVAQTLAAAKMRLDLLKNTAGDGASGDVIDEARELLAQSIRETRALMNDISSPILYDMGLSSAVQNLAEQASASYGLTVSHSVTGEFRDLQQELTVMVYQAVRELLHNVVKHSQARNASVRVTAGEGGIRMIVADDGRGFDADGISSPGSESGFGLFSIRERVKSFNGGMHVESGPGKGTVVTIELPLSMGKAEETRDEEKASPRGRRKRKP